MVQGKALCCVVASSVHNHDCGNEKVVGGEGVRRGAEISTKMYGLALHFC